MLVKKGQNNKIRIYTPRFMHIHQGTRTYTSRFIYINQDWYTYIKICIKIKVQIKALGSYTYNEVAIDTTKLLYIQRDLYIYIKIIIYTSRFVNIKVRINSLRSYTYNEVARWKVRTGLDSLDWTLD